MTVDLSTIAYPNDFPDGVLANPVCEGDQVIDIYYHTTFIPRQGIIKIYTETPKGGCTTCTSSGYVCGSCKPQSVGGCCHEDYCKTEWVYYSDYQVLVDDCSTPVIRLTVGARGLDPNKDDIQTNPKYIKAHPAGMRVLVNPLNHWQYVYLREMVEGLQTSHQAVLDEVGQLQNTILQQESQS